MESFNVKVINPKAKSILKGLVDLNMIKIQEVESTNKFSDFMNKFRKNILNILPFWRNYEKCDIVRKK